jgi:hypothetical protein
MSAELAKKLVDGVNQLRAERDALRAEYARVGDLRYVGETLADCALRLNDELRDLNIELERARSERSGLLTEAVRLEKAHKHQYNMAGLMLREAERTGRENERLRAAGTKLYDRVAHIGCANCGRDDPRLAGSKPGTCKRCEVALAEWDKGAMTDWGDPAVPDSEQGQGNLIDNIIRNR